MSNAITVILYGKKTLDISESLMSLFVQHEVNIIPSAELAIATGNFADRTYPLFDDAMFKVGEELDIKVRYEGSGQDEQSVFKGIITDRKFESRTGVPLMILGVKDPAFRLMDTVATKLFSKKNDKQMIEETLSAGTGLSLKKAASTMASFIFDQFVRKQTTSWRFVLDRAQAHGTLITLDNGAMTISTPSETVGRLTLEVGMDNILDLSVEEDATALNQEIVLNYWNVEKNKVEELKKKFSDANAKAVKGPTSNYNLLGISTKAEAQAMLGFFETRQELGMVVGSIKIPGDASVKLMQDLTLKSMPTSLNGSYTITKVVQKIDAGIWETKIGIGNNSFKLLNGDMQKVPQAFQPKSVEIAKAMKWEKDPGKLGRVPVQIPAFGTEKYWAYPPQTAAGKKQRSFILPEEGEQLVVGFLYNNYNMGVILTSLYLAPDAPKAPFKMDAKSPVGFVSTADMQLIFEDEKKEVRMTTAKKNNVVLNDDKGVAIDAAKDMKLTGKAKINIKASSKIVIKGATIDLN
jgi:phage baseplate assembly protein gpV